MVCEKALKNIGTFAPFGAELLNERSDSDVIQKGSYFLAENEQGGHEAEVYVKGDRVVWSAGRHVRKRFTAPGNIWQAAWCVLREESEPVLALLLVDCIVMYSKSGAIHTVPLTSEPAAIWPVPCGLLVQLASSESSLLKGGAVSAFPRWQSLSSSSAGTPAKLLSMLHPLEDLQGVQIGVPPGLSGAFNDPHESILWSSSTIFYIVTYHAADQRHNIWKVHSPTRTAPLSPPSWTPPQKAQGTPAHLLPIETPLTVSLTRIWTQSSTGRRATTVLHAHDADGDTLLCLLIKETESLVLLKVSGSGASTADKVIASGADKEAVSVAGMLPAKSAVAVEGTRSRPRSKEGCLLDLIILARDGSLMLHVGAYAFCQLAVSSPTDDSGLLPSTSGSFTETHEVWTRAASQRGGRSKKPATPVVTSEPKKKEIVDLKDAVGNRFNLVYADGSTVRMALNVAPESPLVAKCMSVLTLVLPADLHRAFLSRLLEDHAATNSEEWDAFAGLLRLWVKGVALPAKAAAKSSVKKASKNSGDAQKPPDNEAQSDWEFLLHSNLYAQTAQDHSFRAFDLPQVVSQESSSKASSATPEPFPSLGSKDNNITTVREAVLALHLVYEDLKLDTLQWRYLCPLASLLHSLATTLGLVNYQDYYARKWGFESASSPPPILDREATPLDVYSVLRDMLAQPRIEEEGIHAPGHASGGGSMSAPLPTLLTSPSTPCLHRSRQVLALYDILTSESSLLASKRSGDSIRTPSLQLPVPLTRGTTRTAAHVVVLGAVGEGITLFDLDRFPSGVALPIQHALYECRDLPPPDWPAAAFVLIGREDLAAARLGSNPFKNRNLSPLPYAIHLRPVEHSPSKNLGDEDGMEGARARARFAKDLRLDEARCLLNSSQPVAIRISGGADLPDQEQVTQQQALLWQLAQRTTALPAGRGAFTLASADPILTEALPLPKLVLAGRLPAQHNATVNLDVNAGQNLTDLTTWPDFHNGVAAGLRLAPGRTKITRTWITYNTPETPNPSHAGVLMALGLQGHLRVLAATDVYRYLAQEHDVTTVGVLLGMASAHRGTLNPVISKMLYLHIPARHPPSFPELELPPLVQSAALVAVGLLYQGSAHRLTTEILLAEIGRKPGIDAAVDREGYALSAGLALGLVCLGRGNEAVGLADLHIEDRLHHYLAGGSERNEDARARELALGLPKLDDFETSGGQILEGDMVNVDVTAPGATLALALMFLKTNNATVAARLKIPDTHFDLEYVRPDFILLRVLARSLIMWDSVRATESWINSQLPDIVKKRTTDQAEEDIDTEALAQAHVNITAGACFAIGVRFAGTGGEEARKLLQKHVLQLIQQKRGAPAVSTGDSKRVDKGTLETCLNVVALSLSVVMAGTGDLETLRLLRFLRKRMPGEGEVSHGNHMAIGMALGFLFMGGGLRTFATTNEAVAALVVALYPRFPQAPNDHRCHLQAFRHLYVLATEDRCIEAIDVDSNQPVCVPLEITVTDSGQIAESAFTRRTPCLLPERAHLKRVKVGGDRYWPHVIDLQSEAAASSTRRTSLPNLPPHPDLSDHEREILGLGVGTFAEGLVAAKAARLMPSTPRRGEEPLRSAETFRGSARDLLDADGSIRTLYVKRKAGAAEDGSRLASAMTSAESSEWSELLRDSSADPSIVAFAEQFCSPQPSERGSDGQAFSAFCSDVLRECLADEKAAIVRSYLELYASVYKVIDKLAKGDTVTGLDCLAVANLKLALAYCLRYDQAEDASSRPLVRTAFITSLHKRVQRALEDAHIEDPQAALAAYLDSRSSGVQSTNPGPSLRAALGLYLIFHGFPNCGQIAHLQKEMAHLSGLNLDSSCKLPLISFLLPNVSTRAILRLSTSLELQR